MGEMMDEMPPEEREDDKDAYALSSAMWEALFAGIEAGDVGAIDRTLEPLHAADIADLLEQLSSTARERFIGIWSSGIDGEVLSELDEGLREEVIDLLPKQVLAEAVRELESDDVVDLIEDLEDEQQEEILATLDEADRAVIEDALSYPEESAGRLMQREVVRAPEFWSVGEMIDHLRAETTELPEQFYHVILVDPRMKTGGLCHAWPHPGQRAGREAHRYHRGFVSADPGDARRG